MTVGVPPEAWIVITVEEAGALAAAVKVTVALQVGLHGLLENAEALTPVGSAVRMLKVTGEVVPEVRVAVAVSMPPAPPAVIDRVEGVSARVKAKPPETVSTRLADLSWIEEGA